MHYKLGEPNLDATFFGHFVRLETFPVYPVRVVNEFPFSSNRFLFGITNGWPRTSIARIMTQYEILFSFSFPFAQIKSNQIIHACIYSHDSIIAFYRLPFNAPVKLAHISRREIQVYTFLNISVEGNRLKFRIIISAVARFVGWLAAVFKILWKCLRSVKYARDV